jgi:hypothetical protein
MRAAGQPRQLEKTVSGLAVPEAPKLPGRPVARFRRVRDATAGSSDVPFLLRLPQLLGACRAAFSPVGSPQPAIRQEVADIGGPETVSVWSRPGAIDAPAMKAFPESTTPFGVQAEQAHTGLCGHPVIRAYLGSGKQGSP